MEDVYPMIRAPAVLIRLPSPSGLGGMGDLGNVSDEGAAVFDILHLVRDERKDK